MLFLWNSQFWNKGEICFFDCLTKIYATLYLKLIFFTALIDFIAFNALIVFIVLIALIALVVLNSSLSRTIYILVWLIFKWSKDLSFFICRGFLLIKSEGKHVSIKKNHLDSFNSFLYCLISNQFHLRPFLPKYFKLISCMHYTYTIYCKCR